MERFAFGRHARGSGTRGRAHLTTTSVRAMMPVLTIREASLGIHIPLDRIDLEALDRFLRSDRSPPRSMMVPELDGFLTGLAVGPGIIMPSEWLPHVWGGEQTSFAEKDEAAVILGTILARYNEILHEIRTATVDPIFWTDRDGNFIATDWAAGFLEAVRLRIAAWKPLFDAKPEWEMLIPIVTLCGDEGFKSGLDLPAGEEERVVARAMEQIPASVMAIAAYWRAHRQAEKVWSSMDAPVRQPVRASPKTGRNEPCPCGSGKKFKMCCGRSA
jgi:uncharacterized protein